MKYKRKNNKNSLEIMKEEKNIFNENFDEEDYLDEEFASENKRRFFKKNKQEYEYIIDEYEEDDQPKEKEDIKEEIIGEPKVKEEKLEEPKEKENIKEGTNEEIIEQPEVKEEKLEEPKLTIEPIRKVTKEEYTDIARKRQEEKEKQLKLEQEKYEKSKKINKKLKEPKKEFKLNIKKIINVLFVLILILGVMAIVDIIMISKYEKGPYFAINTKTYNDGGTKEYHGLGYKVIKYNQLQGRRDMEIGYWSLKYNTEPITISDIDLAIEFNNNEMESYDNYYKKFVRINSTLKKVNKEKNSIIIGYEDEGGKYTMNIVCKMANKNFEYDTLEVGRETTILGTITSLSEKTSTQPTILRVNNCFAEQAKESEQEIER